MLENAIQYAINLSSHVDFEFQNFLGKNRLHIFCDKCDSGGSDRYKWIGLYSDFKECLDKSEMPLKFSLKTNFQY